MANLDALFQNHNVAKDNSDAKGATIVKQVEVVGLHKDVIVVDGANDTIVGKLPKDSSDAIDAKVSNVDDEDIGDNGDLIRIGGRVPAPRAQEVYDLMFTTGKPMNEVIADAVELLVKRLKLKGRKKRID
jgi:hypothetical protein